MMLPFASSCWVARLDTKYLDASTLANMFINCTGLSVCLGVCYAESVFASQSYGARLYSSVGLYLQRAIALITATLIPLSILWYHADSVLSAIGVSEHSQLTVQYCRIMILGIWPMLAFECLRSFVLAQAVSWPISISVLIAVPLHILVAYLFVDRFGFHGGAWALVFSNWLMLAISCLLVWIRDRFFVANQPEQADERPLPRYMHVSTNEKEAEEEVSRRRASGQSQAIQELQVRTPRLAELIPPLSRECLFGWSELFFMGVPIGVMFMLSYGAFELTLLAANSLGTLSLSVHAILYHTINTWYQLNVGISVAGTTMVGISLGSNEPRQAEKYGWLTVVVAVCHGVLTGGVFTLVLQRVWGQIFTSDDAVLRLFGQVMPVVWLYGLWDAVSCGSNGVLLGCGRSGLPLLFTIISYGGIGVPLAFLFMSMIHPRLVGLWTAMSCAVFSCSLLNCSAIYCSDWQKIALEVQGESQETSSFHSTASRS
eukprot:TRINITY_DN4918_c0_g1_i2.p1 TRINITY_DN4918_c0_g1~~TRINITY_DN4918_c0_g1_i2.p1  ORF type:complete len:486 (-),score=19.64 TRINITY_DN4918_c0_g1_i2:141-1598(-)